MQKTRPRRTGRQTAPAGGATGDAPTDPAGRGRPGHVRNRLIVAVAVVAAAIAGAGAPSVIAASSQLHDSQDLVTLATQTQDALTLAHSLADERDEVTVYIAAGRPKAKAPSDQRAARVDREVGDLRANPDTPAALRADLDDIATLRREALTGKSTALQSHETYSAAIAGLHRLAERLAERQPPRAGAGAYALAELDSAVQQAAAARGLLLAALSVPTSTESVYDPVTGLSSEQAVTSPADAKTRNALSAAAQQARLRSDAAIADFRETAPEAAVGSYDSTVTGPEVDTADKYLASLTDQATLSTSELATSLSGVDAAVSARVELMRGVESSLYDRRTKALARLRDDDVTELEIRIAVLGALLLVAVGIATAMARTLTRPLSVLRRGTARLAEAADPLAEEPVKFTGRNDEFAQVVRSVNALHARALAVHDRIATLESDRKHLVGQRQKMADAREELRTELADAAAQLTRTRHSIHGTFVNLALRTLGLVERQLAVIEGLEEREQDPDRLATLFKLDHFATVMRRHSENLLVLAGAEHGHQHAGPVPLVDVVRAAVSEIERYERVRISALPPHTHLAGFAADDVSHLLAELLENATSFTPPELPVEISGWLLESGEVMLSVQDEGIGMTAERLVRLNSRLAEFDPDTPHDAYETGGGTGKDDGDGIGLGLYVVARLAHRHGVRVQLREQREGGVAAVVVLPKTLLAPDPAAVPPSVASTPGGAPALSFPGADAEVNSNVLQGRSEAEEPGVEPPGEPGEAPADTPIPADAPDPMIALAERAVRDAEADDEAGPATDTGTDADPDVSVPEPAPLPASELTMELLLPAPPAEDTTEPTVPPAPDTDAPFAPATGTTAPDPYAIGPDTHERVEEEPVTDKGLPKRTPKITTPAEPPRPRTASVDAEALRRRLGGFQRGARDGHRDVEAEIAQRTGQTARTAEPARAEETTGETVEEASS
ncbi:nitrate- and nitrite sensing domain-containing protein [Streptomyces sp. WI04-05B]|uniref:nitrate- and nitrite sensing domain-containing protein n=1 Tax=Streptomyces TaxID=1883 RepID=UPI0029A0A72D|nr:MULTISPECIES: nitrate- and nitrite sensing domain-containing protein [unclassified Streptomyces]MDX2547370.1 nitrate- and nitrite sensing domain-containing protein [Streptomyces sp. WI04-05B]MDX2589858.1 nitrate- and nitrite sensing domain-containing protein [Streptomyces sp. WI04-05A]MDX3753404.1 nitrate- and nitrite sensing domain-containing protein [Streptomyces sp. AK08-02]